MKALSITLVLILFFLAGCSTTSSTAHYEISVSGFAKPGAELKKRYFIISGVKDVTVSDLEFQEYSAMFRSVLGRAGFQEATSRNEADVILTFAYFMNFGELSHNFVRGMVATAYDAGAFRRKETEELWSIKVGSVGESSDLRLVMPALMVAVAPYIAKDTGAKISLNISVGDPRIQLMKGGNYPSGQK
jgi:hypothetical protein